MKTIFNFFKNLIFDSQSDMIGLATIKRTKNVTIKNRPQERKEYTLTEMLRRTY